ncbi:sulfotransferase [Jannaschia sp.]|nr:sulfotransferase [Jannaschia sp.]
MEKPLIALLSAPRMGTTQVIHVLNEMTKVANLGEWFDPRGSNFIAPPLLAELSRHFDRPVKQRLDTELGHWAHADPERGLRLLRDTLPATAPAGIFKVFPGHLDAEKTIAHVLPFPNTRFLVVERDPLSSYISFEKGKQTGAWLLTDTTDMRIALDAREYLSYADHLSRHFTTLRAELDARGLPWIDMRYENDIAPGAQHLDRTLRAELGRVGLTLHPSLQAHLRMRGGPLVDTVLARLRVKTQGRRAIGLPRQDRASRPQDKISNWDAFCAEVVERTGSPP